MEEAEHRHLRDELLDATAEPVKDMVSLHLESPLIGLGLLLLYRFRMILKNGSNDRIQ